MIEVLEGVGKVEHDPAAFEKLLGGVHLPRQLELFRRRRVQAFLLELVAR